MEGGYGVTPPRHFFAVRGMVPGLRGLAILHRNGRSPTDSDEGGLRIAYWQRYEIENYFISPELLERYALSRTERSTLFDGYGTEVTSVLDALIEERLFAGNPEALEVWR